MRKLKGFLLLVVTMVFSSALINAQGYLHADGIDILDGEGNNFLSRSIGTGNWMIMEGYMMKTSGAGIHTHTEFRDKLESEIGADKTEEFYEVWLDNHFTKADVDSMKAWGFNAVRPALHYKWFTLPIEDEPVQGENTWLEDGFKRLDSLIAWCSANEMYVMLDMHGAPGGQGKNKDISDYDPSKPSLWESEDNLQKLVALWYELANRYSEEPYVGGYDMINEINWDFANSGNENGCNCTQNQPIIDIFTRIIDTIRLVDQNHIVFVSGNCWGNKYDGLDALAELDDNLVYTFHKYWSYNYPSDMDWITERRDRLNVPLWMSESGENSNTWFTNATRLFEDNNVGWSWWPVKKGGINNVMEVSVNEGYQNLLDYWEKGSPEMTEDEIFEAVMGWADNHKLENTFIHYDVIDALTRQIHSYESKPFKEHKAEQEIYFSDYDLGRNNVAYFDQDTANYHVSTGEYVTWNPGWSYRNDGVGIESCTDELATNGFNVGWTEDEEWMEYTLNSDSAAAYTIELRSAAGGSGGKAHFQVNGKAVSAVIELPNTSGWQSWESTTVSNVILSKGEVTMRYYIDQGGSNLNYFKISNPVSIDEIGFHYLVASTVPDKNEIHLSVNKNTTLLDASSSSDFTLFVNDEPIAISEVILDEDNDQNIIIFFNDELLFNQNISLSYNGSSIKSGDQNLETFDRVEVINNQLTHFDIPTKIQAEDYLFNNGFQREECTDAGKGYNMGFTATGDYLDYKINVADGKMYTVDYRLATEKSNAKFIMQLGDGEDFVNLDTIIVSSTGGWQSWETQASSLLMPEGSHVLRLYVKGGEFNINWFQFKEYSSVYEGVINSSYRMYPNPAKDYVIIDFNTDSNKERSIEMFDVLGNKVYSSVASDNTVNIKTDGFPKGIYFVQVFTGSDVAIQKVVIE